MIRILGISGVLLLAAFTTAACSRGDTASSKDQDVAASDLAAKELSTLLLKQSDLAGTSWTAVSEKTWRPCGIAPDPLAAVVARYDDGQGVVVAHFLQVYEDADWAARAYGEVSSSLPICPDPAQTDWDHVELHHFPALDNERFAMRSSYQPGRAPAPLREGDKVALRKGRVVSILVWYQPAPLPKTSPLEPLVKLTHERLTSAGY